MEPSISFVIATNGVRPHLAETIANLHEVGKEVGDYEVVISGNVGRVKKERRVVLVSDPIDPAKPPRFVWRSGFAKARKAWTAAVADDMTLGETWARGFREFEAGDNEVVYGRLFGPKGELWSREAMENKSMLAVVRREVWGKFPLLECLGEDLIWCKEIRLGGVKWTRCDGLVWKTVGTPKQEGGIGGTYPRYSPESRKEHNFHRHRLAEKMRRAGVAG